MENKLFVKINQYFLYLKPVSNQNTYFICIINLSSFAWVDRRAAKIVKFLLPVFFPL